MEHLTDGEAAMLRYIRAFSQENGYSPSVRDMRAALGIKSTSTVHDGLTRLIAKGYLARCPGKSRALRLCRSAPFSSVRVPVISHAVAGGPLLDGQEDGDFVDFCPRGSAANGELIAIRAADDSMRGAGILPGDFAIVNRTACAENGDLVAVLHETDVRIRLFSRERGQYRLGTADGKKAPVSRDINVLGKVIAVLRYTDNAE